MYNNQGYDPTGQSSHPNSGQYGYSTPGTAYGSNPPSGPYIYPAPIPPTGPPPYQLGYQTQIPVQSDSSYPLAYPPPYPGAVTYQTYPAAATSYSVQYPTSYPQPPGYQGGNVRFEDYGQRNSGPASLTRGLGGGTGRKRKTQSQCCDDAAKKKRLADTSSDHLDREVATPPSTDASMSLHVATPPSTDASMSLHVATPPSTDASMSGGKMMARNMKASELTSSHIYISDIPVKAFPADLLNMLKPYSHNGTRMKVTPTSANKHTVEFAFVEFTEESDALMCLMDIQSQTFHRTHLTYKLFNASSASAELLARFAQVKHIVPTFAKQKNKDKSTIMTKLEANASLSDDVSYNSQNENPPMDELGKAARELEGRTGLQQITVVYDEKSASK